MDSQPRTLRAWIEALPERGRYVFTRAETASVSGASADATRMTLYRLERKGILVKPRRDFFVVVPREYRAAGSPPATWFIDHLMRHLGRRYYVALLTAAALHGAAHQRPMAFQVIADAAERDVVVGRVRIELHVSNLVEKAATQPMQTETGSMMVATPETTAFDLVRFPGACGYWSNVATVLTELAERLDPGKLAAGAARVARSTVQRLGWLLDFLGEGELAEALSRTLQGRRLLPTPLCTVRDAQDAPLDARWRVLVNEEVEPDL